MFIQNIIKTFLSKVIILLANFAVLTLTTNYLGTEGRGVISILMADLAIIVIFNNVLAGSSVAYYMPRVGLSRLVLPAYLWIILSTAVVTFMFSVFHASPGYVMLFLLTVVTSFFALNLGAFVGKERIQLFNVFSLLAPLLLLVLVFAFLVLFRVRTVNAYFLAYFLSQLIVWGISFFYLKPFLQKQELGISKEIVVQTFNYGWKNELSYFLQFLNYRLSYFFILYYMNISSVGLFSVAIAVSESVWLIAKSITTVQYSKIVNLDNRSAAVELTKRSAKISFLATLVILVVLALIPAKLFGLIFGHDFSDIKQLLFLLMPGILAMAVSNVYGHFFAAVNHMKVLVLKSMFGLVVTISLSVILIPLWGLAGACVVSSVSYISSSVYLFVAFLRDNSKTF